MTLSVKHLDDLKQLFKENPDLAGKSMHYYLKEMNRDKLLSRNELYEKIFHKYHSDAQSILENIDSIELEKAREFLSLTDEQPLTTELFKIILEKNSDTLLKKWVIKHQEEALV